MKLTAIIICRSKQEKGLKRALTSVRFSDEILVEEHPKITDYAFVRNQALEKANGEWVIFVDADEVISEDLSSEIKTQISKLKTKYINGYYLKRQDWFLGKWLKYGETTRVKLIRLARKDAGEWIRPVHEVWKVRGRIGELKNPILHYSHQSTVEMLEKWDKYTEMEAEYRLGNLGRKVRPRHTSRSDLGILIEMVLLPLGKFIRNYFWRLGVLDGMPGFINAVMMSWHSFLVRAKFLGKKQRAKSNEQ